MKMKYKQAKISSRCHVYLLPDLSAHMDCEAICICCYGDAQQSSAYLKLLIASSLSRADEMVEQAG